MNKIVKVTVKNNSSTKPSNKTLIKKVINNSSSKKVTTKGKNTSKPTPKNKAITISKSTQDINSLKNNLETNENLNENVNKGVTKQLHAYKSQVEIKTANRTASALNILKNNNREMIRNNSLQPFPKTDPEFYQENQNCFWNKELQRANTEKIILSKDNQKDKRFFRSYFNNFGGVRSVFY